MTISSGWYSIEQLAVAWPSATSTPGGLSTVIQTAQIASGQPVFEICQEGVTSVTGFRRRGRQCGDADRSTLCSGYIPCRDSAVPGPNERPCRSPAIRQTAENVAPAVVTNSTQTLV